MIIPTRNRADLLSAVLESLTRQTLDTEAFEVLVIDNASTDRTAATAHAFSARLAHLRYFFEPEIGLHAGRHRGMQEARGDFLVFADDDIEALPTWLNSIRDCFRDADVAMVGGNNIPMFLAQPPLWLRELWRRSSRNGTRMLPTLSIIEFSGKQREISPLLVWGCNFAIRRNSLIDAGGFHPDGMPDYMLRFRGDGESHVSQCVANSGKRCLFSPGASVYHKVPPSRLTVDYFFQRSFRQGVSDSYTALRNQISLLRESTKNPVSDFVLDFLRRARRLVEKHEVKLVLEQMDLGYKEGYAFHQSAYREDPVVREWVHRERYY